MTFLLMGKRRRQVTMAALCADPCSAKANDYTISSVEKTLCGKCGLALKRAVPQTQLLCEAGKGLERRRARVGNLPFWDHGVAIDPGEGGSGSMASLEARHRPGDPRDEAVVLLDAIVQIFDFSDLDLAVHDRRPAKGTGLVHHSDRGSQYLSIRYTERLGQAGIEPSVGSVGDSYDNALAETIKGSFNNRRLLEPTGNIPPVEAEANFCAALETEDMAA